MTPTDTPDGTQAAYPRAPVDDAEREACPRYDGDNCCDGRTDDGSLCCTRRMSHRGDHVAGTADSEILARWPRTEEPRQAAHPSLSGVRTYDRALGPVEVATHYQAGQASPPASEDGAAGVLATLDSLRVDVMPAQFVIDEIRAGVERMAADNARLARKLDDARQQRENAAGHLEAAQATLDKQAKERDALTARLAEAERERDAHGDRAVVLMRERDQARAEAERLRGASVGQGTPWRKEAPTVEEVRACEWWWMRCMGQPGEVFRLRVMYNEMQYLDVDGWRRGADLRRQVCEWSPCLPPGAAPLPVAQVVEAARQLLGTFDGHMTGPRDWSGVLTHVERLRRAITAGTPGKEPKP